MDRPPPTLSLAFPKPGRALTIVLVAMGSLGVTMALLSTAGVQAAARLFAVLACNVSHPLAQPWGLVTSGLLTSTSSWAHLLFSLVGLYFLGVPLERRLGGWRLPLLLAASVIAGNLATIAVSRLVGVDAQARFQPAFAYGPAAAIAAIAVAWSREYPGAVVNFFFFIPVRGRSFLWITVGLCVLDLIYPAGMPEGVVAPFGGVAAGLLLSGSPSLSRKAWLHLRLALLRRRSGGVRPQDLVATKPTRRARPGGPPLRVVPGGLDDVLKNRTPPKDKRYLN
jgi:membrane associated rhomboid family serine protease